MAAQFTSGRVTNLNPGRGRSVRGKLLGNDSPVFRGNFFLRRCEGASVRAGRNWSSNSTWGM